jgi:hypothetical protein
VSSGKEIRIRIKVFHGVVKCYRTRHSVIPTPMGSHLASGLNFIPT